MESRTLKRLPVGIQFDAEKHTLSEWQIEA